VTEDYRGEHSAPGKDGIPLYDLTQNMPPDVHQTLHQYIPYGVTHSVIMASRGRPRRQVKIYRAVPYTLTAEEQIAEYQKHKRYILKTGRLPPGADWSGTNSSKYFDFISEQIDKLAQRPPSVNQKLVIHPGDWVSLDKRYAVEHGRSNLRNRYRVLSKTVSAKDLFTDGDLEEWGWSP
jgi:hypothetical protein